MGYDYKIKFIRELEKDIQKQKERQSYTLMDWVCGLVVIIGAALLFIQVIT